MDGNGYLINPNSNLDSIDVGDEIIDTMIKFPYEMNGTIYDGEYITKDINRNNIKLFMIFDIYYYKGEKVYILPFKKSNERSRWLLMNEINFNEYNIIDDFEIQIKEYYFGYESNKELDEDEDINYTKIFEMSNMILDKQYRYRTDGLVYLPNKLSVGSKYGNHLKKIQLISVLK